MTDDHVITIFLTTQSKKAAVSCPNCKTKQEFTVAAATTGAQPEHIAVECPTCGLQSKICIERRRYYRKPVWFPGTYYKVDDADVSGDMIVKNISRGGLLLATNLFQKLDRDQKLRVEFHLDDREHSLIQKDVLVRYQNTVMVGGTLSSLIGVEFESDDHPERLNVYFLNHMDGRQ
ncbi:MAG: PilZ domain-containing protein [Thermodesulfobacteriota bacterium]|nr:PilZ domain-containing protein [Thermodesulfobacteriota bacterium]